MKLFIGGSKSAKIPEPVVKEKIQSWVDAQAEILVGDCYGADAVLQKALARLGYEKVSVYALQGRIRQNLGNWPVVSVLCQVQPAGYPDYRRRDSVMSRQADGGFFFWDGKAKGTFVNLVELLSLGKPVEVFLTNSRQTVFLSNLKELKQILPQAPAGPWLTEMEQRRFLERFFPSKPMREYLAARPLSQEEAAGILCGAPVPLEDKLEWAEFLAKQENLFPRILERCLNLEHPADAGTLAEIMVEHSFSYHAGQLRRALRELTLKPGELFLLDEAWYDQEEQDPKFGRAQPFLSLEKVLEYLRHDLAEEEIEPTSLCWYELEKWDFRIGREEAYFCTYYFWMDRPIFFAPMQWQIGDPDGFLLPKTRRYYSDGQHLNLPIPFRPGDIVAVRCYPFRPDRNAVILEVGDNWDCCSVQVLYYNEERNRWGVGALKHGDLFEDGPCILSPLYRLDISSRPLGEEGPLLERVGQFIAGSEERGRRLWEELKDVKEMTGDVIARCLEGCQ